MYGAAFIYLKNVWRPKIGIRIDCVLCKHAWDDLAPYFDLVIELSKVSKEKSSAPMGASHPADPTF